jgi:hypothetical protein
MVASGDLTGLELAGLSEPDERMSRRELEAAVGLDGRQIAEPLAQMRIRMEQSIGTLLITRHARRDCAELTALLAGWNGRYTIEVRGQVTRHAVACPSCRHHLDPRDHVRAPLRSTTGRGQGRPTDSVLPSRATGQPGSDRGNSGR